MSDTRLRHALEAVDVMRSQAANCVGDLLRDRRRCGCLRSVIEREQHQRVLVDMSEQVQPEEQRLTRPAVAHLVGILERLRPSPHVFNTHVLMRTPLHPRSESVRSRYPPRQLDDLLVAGITRRALLAAEPARCFQRHQPPRPVYAGRKLQCVGPKSDLALAVRAHEALFLFVILCSIHPAADPTNVYVASTVLAAGKNRGVSTLTGQRLCRLAGVTDGKKV